MKLRIVAVSVAALLFSAHGFAADLVDGSDPLRLLQIARGFGDARLEKDDSGGDPTIQGKIEETHYAVLFYGCTDGENCGSIQFRAAWDSDDQFSLADMNRWNQRALFGRAYLDSDNDPTLEMTVNLDYGVSRKNLEDTFDWWKVVLADFQKQMTEDE